MLPNVMTPVENLKSGVEAEGYIYILESSFIS